MTWPKDIQPEGTWSDPTEACPHPERWHATDDDSTEVEVTELAAAFVRAIQPDLVLETGTSWGQTAEAIGGALARNGHGKLITCEIDADCLAASRKRCDGLPVEILDRSSLDVLEGLNEETPKRKFGFAWLDSTFEIRLHELALLRPLLASNAVVGIHDCGEPGRAKYPLFSASVAGHVQAWGFSRISLPTPRGVTFLSWP